MLSFDINNQQKVTVTQSGHNGNVFVTSGRRIKETVTIPPGDFIMLLNLYNHIKNNDIRNDFINPYGKNIEQL